MAKSFTRGTVTVRRLWAASALAVAFTLFASVAMAGPPANNPGRPFEQLEAKLDAIEAKLDAIEAKLDLQLPPPTPIECETFEAGLECTGICVLNNGVLGWGVCQPNADYNECQCVPANTPQ